MKLITEEIEKVKVIVEETNGKKSLLLKVFFFKQTNQTETAVSMK